MFSCSLPMPFILNISKSGASYPKEFLKYTYCVFSHDLMAAIFVSQTSPVGVELFQLCKRFLLCQYICIDAGHVSENTE